jgi:hypothetical protein
MARKPDSPCAAGCGRMLWRGIGSRPQGMTICLSCRRSGAARRLAGAYRKGELRPCAFCGSMFTSRRSAQRFCGRSCAAAHRERQRAGQSH